jgi:cytochrome c
VSTPESRVSRLPRIHACVATAGIALLALALTGCDMMSGHGEEVQAAAAMTSGDPARGPALMRSYGCATCHTIPGVTGGHGLVGPPLDGIASRSYIAGVLPNAPQNLIRWIRDPKGVDSLTAMPNVGVTESDARHIAAYLYTLR